MSAQAQWGGPEGRARLLPTLVESSIGPPRRYLVQSQGSKWRREVGKQAAGLLPACLPPSSILTLDFARGISGAGRSNFQQVWAGASPSPPVRPIVPELTSSR